jgi:hypothetical protein
MFTSLDSSIFSMRGNQVHRINVPATHMSGSGSSVSIAIGYGLDGPEFQSWWGRDFPHLSRPVQGAHPAFCTVGTGSFPGLKSGRGVTLTLHPLLVPWPWKGRVIPLLSPMGRTGLYRASVPVQGYIYLYFTNTDKDESSHPLCTAGHVTYARTQTYTLKFVNF